jgi:hypothetical protein
VAQLLEGGEAPLGLALDAAARLQQPLAHDVGVLGQLADLVVLGQAQRATQVSLADALHLVLQEADGPPHEPQGETHDDGQGQPRQHRRRQHRLHHAVAHVGALLVARL